MMNLSPLWFFRNAFTIFRYHYACFFFMFSLRSHRKLASPLSKSTYSHNFSLFLSLPLLRLYCRPSTPPLTPCHPHCHHNHYHHHNTVTALLSLNTLVPTTLKANGHPASPSSLCTYTVAATLSPPRPEYLVYTHKIPKTQHMTRIHSTSQPQACVWQRFPNAMTLGFDMIAFTSK